MAESIKLGGGGKPSKAPKPGPGKSEKPSSSQAKPKAARQPVKEIVMILVIIAAIVWLVFFIKNGM